jgi:hypothetical protein
MLARLETLERRQRVMARRQLHMPAAVAKSMASLLSKRVAIVLGVGIMLGSALGGAALELARRLLAWALAVH